MNVNLSESIKKFPDGPVKQELMMKLIFSYEDVVNKLLELRKTQNELIKTQKEHIRYLEKALKIPDDQRFTLFVDEEDEG